MNPKYLHITITSPAGSLPQEYYIDIASISRFGVITANDGNIYQIFIGDSPTPFVELVKQAVAPQLRQWLDNNTQFTANGTLPG